MTRCAKNSPPAGAVIVAFAVAFMYFCAPRLTGADEPSPKESKLKPLEIANVQRDIPVDFQTEIFPILSKHCLACHSQTKSEGELVLETPETILQGGESGPAVVPGNWNDSLLLNLASHRREPMMPPPDNEVGAKSLSANQLGLIRLWIDQGAKGELFKAKVPPRWQPLPSSIRSVLAIAVSPSGQFFAASRGGRVDLYDLPSKTFITSLVDPAISDTSAQGSPLAGIAHRDLVQSLAIDPSGQWIASGGYQEIKIWRSIEPAKNSSSDLKNNRSNWKLDQVLRGADSPATQERVLSLDFSPDGALLAASGGSPSRSGEITIWNFREGRLLHKLPTAHSDTVFCIRFSPDGKTIATAGADRLAKLFEVASGKHLRSLSGHTHHVLSADWKTDGATLATAGADGVVKTWNPTTETARRTIRVLETEASAITFLGDSFRTATACGDGTIRIHNVDNGGTLRTINVPGIYLHSLAASPDGKQMIAGGNDGKIRIWNADSGQLVKTLEPPESSAKSPGN